MVNQFAPKSHALSLDYINHSLSALNLPTLSSTVADENVINCILSLLQMHQNDVENRDVMEQRMKRLHDDLDSCNAIHNKFKFQLDNTKRELDLAKSQLRMATTQVEALKRESSNMCDELRITKQNMVNCRQLHFVEMRKAEKELTRLKDRLTKTLHKSNSNEMLHINNGSIEKHFRSKSLNEASDVEEYYKAIMDMNEKQEMELIAELDSLRTSVLDALENVKHNEALSSKLEINSAVKMNSRELGSILKAIIVEMQELSITPSKNSNTHLMSQLADYRQIIDKQAKLLEYSLKPEQVFLAPIEKTGNASEGCNQLGQENSRVEEMTIRSVKHGTREKVEYRDENAKLRERLSLDSTPKMLKNIHNHLSTPEALATITNAHVSTVL